MPPPPLARYKRISWWAYLVVVVATWAFGAYQSRITTVAPVTSRALLTTLYLFFSVVPYAALVAAPFPFTHWRRSSRLLIWFGLAVCGGVFAAYALESFTPHWGVGLAGAFFLVTVYVSIYVGQRLWIGEQALNEVLREINHTFLSMPGAELDLEWVANLIGARLRQDSVFILLPNPERTHLHVEGAYGRLPHASGFPVPIQRSLTGSVFLERQSIAWNDVSACPYYFGDAGDSTAAEIAAPIMHNEVVFGVIDVHAMNKNVFGPDDVTALEIIGLVLGAAMAGNRQDVFFQEAVELWEKTAKASNTSFASEEEVFDLFAEFAQERLDADLVIYFPLSFAGCPIKQPYTRGGFYDQKPLKPPVNDVTSALTLLIERWQPYYATAVADDPIISQATLATSPRFIERETIESVCFIPVGLRHERLGALFLNFRQPQSFSRMFQFTVLSLAQSIAKATAPIRYRDIFYQSFGQPEFGLHNIVNRYGFKEGIASKAAALWRSSVPACCPTFTACPLHDLYSDMDDFLEEIRLAKSSVPPNFWRDNLTDRLHRFASDLPPRHTGRRPNIQLDLDKRIERESPWVKLALYRVITEAINNAIIHGDAQDIHVDLKRLNLSIDVTIVNDGSPLPDDAYQRRSKHGIYTLLRELEARLGAETTVEPQPDQRGTTVNIIIPALPLNHN